jgi:hypothetical protein
MKKILAILGIVSALSFSTQAQTNSVISTNSFWQTLWDDATTGSNYWVAPYMMKSTKSSSWGGGIAIAFDQNPSTTVLKPILDLSYFDRQFWFGNLSLQLQPPRNLLGKLPTIPFLTVGGTMPFSGAAGANGNVFPVYGVGLAVRTDFLSSNTSDFWHKLDLFVAYKHTEFSAPELDKFKNMICAGLNVKL